MPQGSLTRSPVRIVPSAVGEGVDAGAWVAAGVDDVKAVVLGERLEDQRVAGEVFFGEVGHDTARDRDRRDELDVIADRERALEPGVLKEARFGSVDDHVHAKAVRVEAAARLQLLEVGRSSSGHDAQREEVEERFLRYDGGQTARVEERGAELCSISSSRVASGRTPSMSGTYSSIV